MLTPLFMALWGIVTFAVVEILFFLPSYIMGILLVLISAKYAKQSYKESPIFKGRMVFSYDDEVLDAWIGNWEDGICPTGTSHLKWFLRNPCTNLRFCPGISTFPSRNTRWVGSLNEIPPDGTPGWFLAWSHGYVGFRWQWVKPIFKINGIWIGWKINPRDARELPYDDYRRWGLGTSLQLLRFK